MQGNEELLLFLTCIAMRYVRHVVPKGTLLGRGFFLVSNFSIAPRRTVVWRYSSLFRYRVEHQCYNIEPMICFSINI